MGRVRHNMSVRAGGARRAVGAGRHHAVAVAVQELRQERADPVSAVPGMTPREAIARMRRNLARLSSAALDRQIRLVSSTVRQMRRELAAAHRGTWTRMSRESALVVLRAGLADMQRRQGVALGEDLAEAVPVSWRDARAYMRAADKAYLGAARPLRFEAAGWIDREAAMVGQTRLANYRASLARYGSSLSQAVEEAASRAVLLGRSFEHAIDEVAGRLRAEAGLREWEIRRLVQTEVSAAYNQVQLDALLEEDTPADPMLKRLIATFDRKTGRDSVMLHGQVRPVREPFYDASRGRSYMAPPNRPHDREIVVGWRKGYGRPPPATHADHPLNEPGQDGEPRLAASARPPRGQPAAPGTPRKQRARNLRAGDVLAVPGRPRIERVRETERRVVVETSTGARMLFALGTIVAVMS